MSAAARRLIESFAALPEADQREVLLELLRNTGDISYASPSDDELVLAADEIFQEIDRREAQV